MVGRKEIQVEEIPGYLKQERRKEMPRGAACEKDMQMRRTILHLKAKSLFFHRPPMTRTERGYLEKLGSRPTSKKGSLPNKRLGGEDQSEVGVVRKELQKGCFPGL